MSLTRRHALGATVVAVAPGVVRHGPAARSQAANYPSLFARDPGWAAIFDMDGALAAQTRRRMPDMAAADKMRVSLYHASFQATGFIAKDGAGFQMVPASWPPAAPRSF